MDILIIGGGGREHALAWKSAQSPLADQVYVAPGNAGTARESGVKNVAIATDDIQGLLEFALQNKIGLTIVGPEVPLVMGLVDEFKNAGLHCFGPDKAPAQLEGSKAFSKEFLDRHDIPTAEYQAFENVDSAVAYIEQQGAPIVIKADGLAAGKGVILAESVEQAIAATKSILVEGEFGVAGASVVIEEFLHGEEASFICMADGEYILPMASSQDHKAAHDGDLGPNTGGMGAYSPAPIVDMAMHERIMAQVIRPTISGLKAEGMPYTGFLYAGVMIDADNTPKVLEFNCRFGDPETQPIMLRLESDLVEHCLAAVEGRLNTQQAVWDERPAVGVVLAAEGYPASYRNGDLITGIDLVNDEDVKVFQAGVVTKGEDLYTAGGRVLCVTALGDSVGDAQKRAYLAADKIDWQGQWHRNDIAYRAIERERAIATKRQQS